jgi:hypothetical protein
MKPPAFAPVLLSWRVMQWFSNSPPVRILDFRKPKYDG